MPDDPRREKFARLTAQEERAGLRDETATIGTRTGWAERLRERGHAQDAAVGEGDDQVLLGRTIARARPCPPWASAGQGHDRQ